MYEVFNMFLDYEIVDTICTFTNLSLKPKNWIKNLALEAETALTYLPYTEQEGLRFQIARNLQSLYRHCENNKGYNTKNMNSEKHTIQSIKNKLQSNRALITKEDKVILS
jgi:hypothetical protein